MTGIEEHTLNLDDIDINYIDVGQGDVMLFLHHGGGFWQTWQHQITHFQDSHRIICFDWPSHGKSSVADKLDLEYMTQILNKFLLKKGIQKFHLIGHCIGASIALNFASSNTDRVLTLSLLNVCPGARFIKYPIYSKFLQYIKTKERLGKVVGKLFIKIFELFYVRLSIYPAILFNKDTSKSDPLYQTFRNKIDTAKQQKVLLQLLLDVESYSLSTNILGLASVDALMWGTENKVTTFKTDGQYFDRHILSCALEPIADSGHLSQYESHKKVNQLIRRAIEKIIK